MPDTDRVEAATATPRVRDKPGDSKAVDLLLGASFWTRPDTRGRERWRDGAPHGGPRRKPACHAGAGEVLHAHRVELRAGATGRAGAPASRCASRRTTRRPPPRASHRAVREHDKAATIRRRHAARGPQAAIHLGHETNATVLIEHIRKHIPATAASSLTAQGRPADHKRARGRAGQRSAQQAPERSPQPCGKAAGTGAR